MKVYAVGGSVRDELLGKPVTDRDWVVVGATPEEMTRRGFRPVGADFPVFLHPDTQEEYALARTERKTAPGYRGFTFHASPEVTLEEDLRRRDLTINAMARADDGTLIDPFGGEADLRRGLLRHVSEAFAEDPVRILRVSRFAARLGFRVADETLLLMRQMVASGEADHLVPERVWQEVSRGLQERQPSRMLAALDACGALPRVMPELAAARGERGNRLDVAATAGLALPERFALLTLGLPEGEVQSLAERLRAPSDCRDMALLSAREASLAGGLAGLGAEPLLALLERCDAFRRPERLQGLLRVLAIGSPASPDATSRVAAALAAAKSVDAAAVARSAPENIAGELHATRVKAIASLLAR